MVVISACPSDHVALAQVFVKLIYLSRWKTTCRTVSVLTQLNIKPQQGCCHSGQTGSVAQQLLLAQHLQRGSLNLFITQLQLKMSHINNITWLLLLLFSSCVLSVTHFSSWQRWQLLDEPVCCRENYKLLGWSVIKIIPKLIHCCL